MDIKYFKVATLFATGLFLTFLISADFNYERENYTLIYVVSLVVIWGTYSILSKKWLGLESGLQWNYTRYCSFLIG